MKLLEQEISLFDAEKYNLDNGETFELRATVDGKLIKSKERVQHHGEVFTPKWMVLKMLAEPAIQKKNQRSTCNFSRTKCWRRSFFKRNSSSKVELC